ncbi:hypothetical protein [Sphingobacterium suaedae]|uniref:DUF4595 domain-containing protein n=1 Tax=Sphingobacterium suaedae TaxID=1686402 RepID=A0ABW5KHM4_9SPHI
MKRLSTWKKIVVLMALSVPVFSCSSDDDIAPDGSGKQEKRLSKIEIDAQNHSAFTYNDGLLTAMEELTDGHLERSTILYAADKKPTEMVMPDGKIKFVYAGDRLVKEELYETGSTVPGLFNEYIYDGKHVKEVIGYVMDEGEKMALFKRKFSYYANGDLQQVEVLEQGLTEGLELSITITYVYDDKKSPYIPTVGPYIALLTQTFAKHNVIKETTVDASGAINEEIVTTYSYDDQGYPTAAVEKKTEHGGTPQTTNKKFIYLP